MKIQIKNQWNGSVIFETDAENLGAAILVALKSKANLCSADLRGANLRGADLCSANLSGANLSSACMLAVCSCCKRFIGFRPVERGDKADGQLTHGICPACEEKLTQKHT